MRLAIAASFLVIGVAGAMAAASDFEVQSSNVPGYKPGQALAKGAAVSVPDGGKITLIDRTGSAVRTKDCVGKYDGPIEGCPSKGVRDGKGTSGATRGVTR